MSAPAPKRIPQTAFAQAAVYAQEPEEVDLAVALADFELRIESMKREPHLLWKLSQQAQGEPVVLNPQEIETLKVYRLNQDFAQMDPAFAAVMRAKVPGLGVMVFEKVYPQVHVQAEPVGLS